MTGDRTGSSSVAWIWDRSLNVTARALRGQWNAAALLTALSSFLRLGNGGSAGAASTPQSVL